MIVEIFVGPPGCGKSGHLMNDMLDHPAHYLFALPRTDLIEEKADDLRSRARARGLTVHIEPVHGNQRASGTVERRIDRARQESELHQHAILLITHDMLTRMDLSPFGGDRQPRWDARIDEVPDAVISGRFRAPAAAVYLQQVYELEPSTDVGWWQVRLRPDAPGPSMLMRDTHLSDLVCFDKAARSHQGALVDVGAWQDATLRGRTVQWHAVWTPGALEGFASVAIAAAAWTTSLCGRASARVDGHVTYSETLISPTRSGGPKVQVRVRYFTHGHIGSTAWWADPTGRRCLNAVLRHLAQVRDLGYYSGNRDVMTYFEGWLDHAVAVSPRQSGTNRLISHTSCAFIYSNKRQDADQSIQSTLDITSDDIMQAREMEDIHQFIMRGAIRDPTFEGEYTIYVYDRMQAEAIYAYLTRHRIADDIVIESVPEAGILDVARPERATRRETTPIGNFADHEAARRELERERGVRRRAESKAASIAAGTYRARGRPRKNGGE